MKPLTQNINGVEVPLFLLRSVKDKSVIYARTVSNTIHPNPPNPGSGQEYLAILIDDYPIFDPIFSTVEQSENEFKGTWQIAYIVSDRSKEDILKAAEEVKRAQVRNVIPQQDLTENQTIVLAAILNAGKYAFSEGDQAVAAELLAQATKLANNRAKLAAANAEIEAGRKPDLKTGWDVAVAAEAEITP